MDTSTLTARATALWRLALIVPVTLGLLLSLVPLQNAEAATLVVDTTADNKILSDCTAAAADCNLRGAIIKANQTSGTDTIRVPEGTFLLARGSSGEDAAKGGDLDITDDLILRGRGADVTIIDGNKNDRVFDIAPNGFTRTGKPITVQLSGITIRNGKVDVGGGGILYQRSALTINDSILHNNQAGDGAGLFGGDKFASTKQDLTLINVEIRRNTVTSPNGNGGGIYATGGGSLTIKNSTIASNMAGELGGGIFALGMKPFVITASKVNNNRTGGGGGGILTDCISIKDSTISGNQVTNLQATERTGGGLNLFGGSECGGSTISNSTIRGNSARQGGGGIRGTCLFISGSSIIENEADTGGGIYNQAPTVNCPSTIFNSTVSGNKANTGAGIADGKHFQIINTTIAYNTGGNGLVGLPGSLGSQAINTIIANNQPSDCSGISMTTSGNNLDGDGTCGLVPNMNDLPQTNPLLQPLALNGGTTLNHALKAQSPAIDAGNNGIGACNLPDQRGVQRPKDGNGDGIAICDMGAYEFVP